MSDTPRPTGRTITGRYIDEVSMYDALSRDGRLNDCSAHRSMALGAAFRPDYARYAPVSEEEHRSLMQHREMLLQRQAEIIRVLDDTREELHHVERTWLELRYREDRYGVVRQRPYARTYGELDRSVETFWRTGVDPGVAVLTPESLGIVAPTVQTSPAAPAATQDAPQLEPVAVRRNARELVPA